MGVTWIDGADAQQGLVVDGCQEVHGKVADGVAREVPLVQYTGRHLRCIAPVAVGAVQQPVEVAAPDGLPGQYSMTSAGPRKTPSCHVATYVCMFSCEDCESRQLQDPGA